MADYLRCRVINFFPSIHKVHTRETLNAGTEGTEV